MNNETCISNAKNMSLHPFISGVEVNTFDSQLASPARRLSYWNDTVNAHNGVRIDCATPNFIGKISNRLVGNCAIHAVNIETPHRATRTHVKENLCFVNIQLHNAGVRFNGHREQEIPAGSMVLYDAAQTYGLDFTGASESLILSLPKSYLLSRVPDLQSHLEDMHYYDSALVSMLTQLIRGILNAPLNLRQSAIDNMNESLISMVAATLSQIPDNYRRQPTYSSSAILKRIKNYVLANLANPELCPVMVAQSMGITVNHLHKVFLTSHTTLMHFVLNERLERCRLDISKCATAGAISQIAYRWGFNDASHFSRSFRKYFGMSPREYRSKVLSHDSEIASKYKN